MRRKEFALVIGITVILLLGSWAPVAGGVRTLALVDRESALSDPHLRDRPAYVISAENVLVAVPETEIEAMRNRAHALVASEARTPMWVTPSAIPEEAAARLDLEILLTEGVNTVFAASEDAAYDLVAEGYFVVRMKLVPLREMEPAPWIEPLVENMLRHRPLDGPRVEFLRAMVDSVDTLRLKNILHFLEYDDANNRFRSRFQVRPETRQQVVPYMRDMLASYVTPYGGEALEQEFVQKLGGAYACVDTIPCDTIFTNVIATKPGRKTSAHYIICAHYDAIASRTPGWSSEWYREDVPAPGADDNGTGVAGVLESARLLSGLDLDVGLKFILFSGEELGLLGSDYYAENLSPEDSVIGVVNLDMVGYADETPLLEIVYDWRSGWLSDQLEDVGRVLELGTELEQVNLSGVANSDHASFWQLAIPANMMIEELETLWDSKGGPINPHYHSVGDTAGILDMNLAGDATRLVVGLISRFAEMPGDTLVDIWITEGGAELDWPGRRVGLPPVAGDSLQVELRALNVGAAMEQAEPYVFEVWKGTRPDGDLMYTSTEALLVGRGEYTSVDYSWETDPDTYGNLTYTFVLLPVDEALESDLTNNVTSTELALMPVTAVLRDIRVTPNPVSFSGEGPNLRFEILHPEGDFNAVMDVWVFDILGSLVGRASFESTPLVHDFGPGDNAIDLSRVVSRQIAPGLYICRTRLELLGEPGTFDTKFKFAVDR